MRLPVAPKPLVPILILLALLVPSTAAARLDPGDEPRYELAAQPADVEAVASYVAGRPVELRCETAEALRARVGWALAYVVLDGSSVIHAGPTVCGWLKQPASPLFGEGLLALIHEAVHLATNSVDESRVTCEALARMPDVLARFYGGLDAATAMWGAHRLFAMLPDEYRRC